MRNKYQIVIVIPSYNEDIVITESIEKVRDFLLHYIRRDWLIVVADNGSDDRTLDKLKKLHRKYHEVIWFHIDQAGKGRAIKKTIEEYEADIIFMMDADLSTDLDSIPMFIEAINAGQDIVIGSRLLKESVVQRSFKREFLSRGYNLILKILFDTKFSDAQCGFKAFRRQAIVKLLPKVRDDEWFFDTELLIHSQRNGLRIRELPIRWTERKKSKEHVFRAIFRYVSLLFKLRLRLLYK